MRAWLRRNWLFPAFATILVLGTIGFLGEHFGSLAGEKVTAAAAPAEPPWYRVGTGRASAAKR